MARITLFTYQRAGHNICKPFAPNTEYGPGGAYGDMVAYLGWPVWVWAMPALSDFNNRWFNDDHPGVLWRLSVPADLIRWCALDAQCTNRAPVAGWFYPSADAIRQAGDIPQALIPAPVLTEWVL